MIKYISNLTVILYKPNHINHWAIPVIFLCQWIAFMLINHVIRLQVKEKWQSIQLNFVTVLLK